MTVTVTLEFASPADAADALARMAGVVAPADRPDAGARPVATVFVTPPVPPAPAFDPAKAFGGTPLDMQPATVASGAAVVPVGPPVSAAQTPSSELDATGLPWDPRIHSSTKSKNADNTWRAKRGTDEIRPAIEAQLRAAVAAPSAPAGTAVPPAPATVPLPPPLPAPPAPSSVAPVLPATTAPSPAASAAPIPTLPVVAPPPLQPAAPAAPTSGADFGSFMAELSPLFASDPGGANAKIAAALATVQLTALGQLAARHDLIPAVRTALAAA